MKPLLATALLIWALAGAAMLVVSSLELGATMLAPGASGLLAVVAVAALVVLRLLAVFVAPGLVLAAALEGVITQRAP